MRTLFALIAVGLDAAATRFSSKFEKVAAAVVVGVVGIGLLVGSLSLLSEPIQHGPFPSQTVNVCAPVVSSVTVTDDGSAGLRVSVDISHGWDMFRLPSPAIGFRGYKFETFDAVRHYQLLRGDFWAFFDGTKLKTWDGGLFGLDLPVYFDYFVRGGSGGTRGSGGQYFSMKITPEWFGLRHVRGEHYHTLDHSVDITLYVTNFGGRNGTTRLPIGQYRMHCWISDTDGNGYYVPVHFGDQTFREGLD